MDNSAIKAMMGNRYQHSILETIEVETGNRKIIKEFDCVIEAPNWTADGRYLVYNSQGHMYTLELETEKVTEINTGFAINCNNDHVLSPDGVQLAVSHFTEEDFCSRIYRLPFSGGAPVLVTPNGPSYLHGWSPDGKTLAYCAERNGQYDIYSISVSGGAESQLTDLPGLDDGPEYSSCGKYIWFNSTRSGLMQIWRMNKDGSNPVRMTFEEANCWFPHVSPDGSQVVYIAYGKNDLEPWEHLPDKDVEIRVMSSAGGPSRTIVKLLGGQGTMNVNSWSPDGKRIAFVSYRP